MYLAQRGLSGFEGHCQQVPQEVQDLQRLTSEPNLKVMEIGFNAGHSAEAMLSNNSSLQLTSFDLGEYYWYIYAGKEYFDDRFPNRHRLIVGDSRITVPKFVTENGDVKFDVIFIDGGHQYELAKADLLNCKALAHADTVVILDDTIWTLGWHEHYTEGPTKAWSEEVAAGHIVQLGTRDYQKGRGISWGRYVV